MVSWGARMRAEWMFKTFFGVLFFALIATREFYKRKFGAFEHGVGKSARSHLAHEARILLVLRPLLALFFYTFLFAWILSARWSRWAFLPLPVELRWSGEALSLGSLLLLAASYDALRKNYQDTLLLRQDHELVATGPYSRIRHPIYLSFLLLMVSAFLLSANWVIGLSGIILIASVMLVRIPREEKLMRERFGAIYQDYEARTGRLFPPALPWEQRD